MDNRYKVMIELFFLKVFALEQQPKEGVVWMMMNIHYDLFVIRKLIFHNKRYFSLMQ